MTTFSFVLKAKYWQTWRYPVAIGVKECTGIRGCALMCSHDRPSAYLPFAPEQIVEAELRLSDDTGRLRQTISEVVWNGG